MVKAMNLKYDLNHWQICAF